MSEDVVFPISEREAASLPEAHRLYRKSLRLLERVAVDGRARFGGATTGWPDDDQVGDIVRRHFRHHGRFMLAVRGASRLGLLFGLETGAGGEATFTVWLEADPGYGDVRHRVEALSAAAGLPTAGWSLRRDGWQIVECRARTVALPTLDAAVEWFMARFGDLERAGLLALQRELADLAPSVEARSGSRPSD